MLRWTKDASGDSFTSIVGMDPRADCLLGAWFPYFQPAGPDGLIPFLVAPQSPEALAFVNQVLAPDDRRDVARAPVFAVRFGQNREMALEPGDTVTMMARRSFFVSLARRDGPFQRFADAPKQILLCLPIDTKSLPNWRPGEQAPMLENPDIPPTDWNDGTVVVGVIDDGIAFANARFRTDDGHSRVQCFWDQNGPHTPGTVPYGQEILKAQIDFWLDNTITGGQVDEDAIYRLSGLIDFAQPGHKSAALRLAHGTHVLDLAAGGDPGPAPTKRPIIAVQLPVAATANQSGAGLENCVSDAIAYIQTRARLLGPNLPLVINFSYGTIAGPHDGTFLLEQVIDNAIAAPLPTTNIVLPAGNSNLGREHEAFCFDEPDATIAMQWRVQPDSAAPAQMQVWLPYGGPAAPANSRLRLAITTPDGVTTSPWLEEHNGWGLVLTRNGQVVCCVRYSFQPFPTCRGVFNICLQPTTMFLPAQPANLVDQLAPSGVWTVRLQNVLLKPEQIVNAWIERDDLVYGYPRRGRQSYFDEPCYHRYNRQGVEIDDDTVPPDCNEVRAGMINAIATGAYPVAVGGFRRKELSLGSYSAGGPITPTRGGSLSPASRKPDGDAVSDDSIVHTGVLASGTRSGSCVPMQGTSVAAPQVTSWIADQLAAGLGVDRTVFENFATLQEAGLGAARPPLQANRGGRGRIDFPATMRGPRTRYWMP
jgi:hypothetical protein